MIKKLHLIFSPSYNPYYNLALEKFMFDNVSEDELILYLWQNKHTVVCGRNQNPFKECNISKLERDSGLLTRRLSGGGAVYHDLGNLNFTFITTTKHYSVEKQLEVIKKACEMAGIFVTKTGRNDITAEGKKFSGNAFHKSENKHYHHGTLMVCVDKDNLTKYLNVDKEKLLSKGVSSVKSRVINLSDLNPDLDIETMKDYMVKAYHKTYGMNVQILTPDSFDKQAIEELENHYKSPDWIYGTKIKFDYSFGRRFDWGNIEFAIKCNQNVISDISLFSDAMDENYIIEIKNILKGCTFSYNDIVSRISSVSQMPTRKVMLEDIKKLILDYV